MTINSFKTKEVYDGNGATILWPLTFPYNKDKDMIEVYTTSPAGVTTKLTAHYWVDTINDRVKYPGYEAGAEPPPSQQPPILPAGWKITLRRKTALTQLLDLINKGDFNADTLEAALDKLTMITQEVQEQLDRAVKGDVTVATTSGLPAPVDGALIGWSGDKLANKTGVPSLIDVNAIQRAVDHVDDPVAAHMASAVAYQGSSGLASTDVEGALDELDAEKSPVGHTHPYEPTLGNPAEDDMALTSTAAGARSWKKMSGGAPGISDFIVPGGRKFSPASDLNLLITQGVEWIGETKLTRFANTIGLSPRRAQLVYDTKAGGSDKVVAAFPAADAGTVNRWIIDGGATIASTVGTNNLTRTGGMTQVDGWAADYAGKSDGTGTYSSANSTGFPSGLNPIVEMCCMFTYGGTTGARQTKMLIGGNTSQYFGLEVTAATDNLVVLYGGTLADTSYTLSVGKTYMVHLQHNGTTVSLFVNGVLVHTVAASFTIYASGLLNLLYMQGNGFYTKDTIHYVEIRNALRTPAQIAAISNALLLPVRYDNEWMLPGSTGTNIGTMTTAGGLAAAFDGATSTGISGCAQVSGTGILTGTTGKNWGVGVTKTIKRFALYPSSDYGYSSSLLNVRIRLYGSNSGLGVSSVLLWDSGTIPYNRGVLDVTSGINVSTAYQYHWIELAEIEGLGAGHGIALAEVIFYTAVNAADAGYSDIRSILPADSISLGFVRTDATKPIEANDTDWKYRREGVPGMSNYNGRVFLGRKYFNGTTTLAWDNPFGTRKVDTRFTWAQDASGRNESDLFDLYYNAANYGYRPDPYPTDKIQIYIYTAGYFAGAVQTSGYIGCYAEVM